MAHNGGPLNAAIINPQKSCINADFVAISGLLWCVFYSIKLISDVLFTSTFPILAFNVSLKEISQFWGYLKS